ncbi:UNVERIFIED_CONTAM: Protein CHROMATIN REMODELING 24 [Sesamum indicum]
MSLNQLHNRFLHDLSASHSKPKPGAVEDNTQWKVKAVESTEGNDDVPRFDFDTTSPPPLQEGEVNVEEPVSTKIKDSSPQLFAGIADFDSPSPSFAFEPRESSKTTEAGSSSCEANPTISGSSEHNTNLSVGMKLEHIGQESSKLSDIEDNASKKRSLLSGGVDHASNFRGEERQTKVKIEGRRRLCRISKNNDSASAAGRKSIRDEEPKFDGISDFDSPPQVNKTCESAGNEIRDILNDLSARLEILSIEKKRVPKKVDPMEDFQDTIRSKLHDLTIKEGVPEYHNAASSYLLSSDCVDNTIESKVGSIVTSELQGGKTSISKGKDDTCVGKANRTLYKCEGLNNDKLMRAHVKSASTTESQAYNYSREVEGFDTGDYVAFSKKDKVKQVDRRQEKIIDVSDNESDEVTVLEDHVDDLTLSGPKLTYKLPRKLAKMLYPHQREGLKWLWSLHCKGKGGILGDDMGLGKTMQICSFIAGLFHSNLVRRVLVVAPKTLLAHWINELSTVGLSEKTREYFATCTKTRHYELQYVLQDKGVLLTTYDIVRNNAKSLCGDYHYNDDGDEDETTWDYMILDEGHLIKNPSTQRAKSLLQIPCLHRIIISGTPLQNNLKELWALFNFCCPELLGDKKEFKEKYEHFINRGNEKNASDREKRIGSAVAREFRECIQPFFLRRLKSEVFHDDTTLSKKNEIIVWLRLTRCQRQLYEAFLKSEIVLSACDGSPLAALTILKKICDHPLLLTKRAAEDVLEGMDSIVDQEDHRVAERLAMHIADVAERFDIVENHDISCKISFILSLLGDLVPKGHNVLIFSQTRKMLNLIQESLISNHYKYIRIDGTTKASDRAKIVKVFKGGLFRSATEHKEQIRYFSQQDLRDLFSLPKQGFDISPTQQQLLEEHDHQHTMEESLRAHVEFLETLNIAGISQHNLLFSKAAPLQAVEIEEEAGRLRGSRFMGNPPTRSSIEQNVDGAHYAFNPKDIKKIQKNSNPDVREPSEDEIRARINRLSQIFADKWTKAEEYMEVATLLFWRLDLYFLLPSMIGHLSEYLDHQAAVSRLPDNGEKIHRQIISLNLQLDQLRMAKRNKEDVIEL